jgi:hypothetical protein
MAVKLYPPVIEGALPAFYGTDILSVPFSMNRAVSASDVDGFALKIKTVSGNYLTTLTVQTNDTERGSFDKLDDMYVDFNIRLDDTYKLFKVGQYYKVQLAYIHPSGQIGYYSTVGVIKYTTEPTVSIENFEFGQINQHNYSYVGVYSQDRYTDKLSGAKVSRDTTEKMYSCRFIIYNDDDSIFEDSGEIIHNTQNDEVSYMSTETHIFAGDLDMNRSYYIRFIATTTNGLRVSSPRYRIIQRRSVSPDIKAELKADLDYDNGHIKLSILDTEDPIISGAFLISRASSRNNYTWEEFKRFDLQSIVPSDWGIVDCTIEQGVTYKYSLQQYNDSGVYSDRIISNSVFSDFEDAFLYDGEKQLKIRFNPKVTSFKTTVQETKVDTIGRQHPTIIRNGNVSYKDFPISGLISYHMDDTHMFMSAEELKISENNYNLTGENITAERLFKLTALDWLNNGKPKLFRSPTEGNYIVRLMNVSLSPQDQLGRMLHNFSATAYEIAKCDMTNLMYYNLIDTSENFSTQTRWVTVDLVKQQSSDDLTDVEMDDLVQLNTRLFYSLSAADMRPGAVIYIKHSDEKEPVSIMIGATGAYRIESEKPFEYIKISKRDMAQGLITYSYRSKAANVFNLIQRVHVEDVPCQQYIGSYPSGYYTDHNFVLKNIFYLVEDVRTEVLHVAFIRFIKRDVQDVYINFTYQDYKEKPQYFTEAAQRFYIDMDCTQEFDKSLMDPLAIYHLRCKRSDYRYYYKEQFGNGGPSNNEQYIVDRATEYFAPYIDYYYDPKMDRLQPITPELFDIVIDDEVVNIAETGKYILKDGDDIANRTILVNDGIITEMSFAKQIITYSMETNDSIGYTDLKNKKANYEYYLEKYYDAIGKASKLDGIILQVKTAYNLYVDALDKAIKQYKEENGIE